MLFGKESSVGHIMAETPDNYAFQDQLGVFQQGAQHGLTSHNEVSVALLKIKVQRLVTELMATNTNREEIIRRAGAEAGNDPALIEMAQEIANKQTAPEQFNVFAPPRQEANEPTATETSIFAALLEGFSPAQGISGGLNLGSTTAALAEKVQMQTLGRAKPRELSPLGAALFSYS